MLDLLVFVQASILSAKKRYVFVLFKQLFLLYGPYMVLICV